MNLLPGPHQGLVGDDIEGLGPFRLQQGQVVVAGQVEEFLPLEQFQALVGAGVIAHQVPQVEDRVHVLSPKPGQHGLQGLQIAVDIGDDGQSHNQRRFLVFSKSFVLLILQLSSRRREDCLPDNFNLKLILKT